jgi:hypothetical protein
LSCAKAAGKASEAAAAAAKWRRFMVCLLWDR